MIGYFSPSSEVLLYELGARGRFVQSLDGRAEPLSAAHTYALGAVTDWVEFDCESTESLLREFSAAARRRRFVSIAIALLHGLSPTLTRRGCVELEELLQAGVPTKTVVNQLLCAPMASTSAAESIMQAAKLEATGAVHAVFSEVLDLQVPLRRLAGIWLDMPLDIWRQGPLTQSTAWLAMINAATLDGLLRSTTDGRAFLKSWNEQLFVLNLSPIEVQHLRVIGNYVNQSLFEVAGSIDVSLVPREGNHPESDSGDSYAEPTSRSRRRPGRRAALERVLERIHLNIGEILERLRRGEDKHAKRFLTELVEQQIASGDDVHAVKTLCNVAQRCKEMLRYDFERMCLEAAIQIRPNDSHALIQWGDHLKRIGHFHDATVALKNAAAHAEGDSLIVAMSCHADVSAARGNYQRAIEEYRKIPQWSEIPSVRTAIADCLRAAGKFDEAHAEYSKLLEQWGPFTRAAIGIAEIQKLMGLLDKSLKSYEAILSDLSRERESEQRDRDIFVAKMSRVNVLKRMGSYRKALRSLLELKRERPYDMTVLAQLATLYGLLDQNLDGLKEIGVLEPASALGDWLRYYVRGLLQLKCGESATVRKSLIARWEERNTEQRADDAFRLASASAFLALEDFGKAFAALNEHTTELDPVLRYVQLVLEYHLSLKQADAVRASQLRLKLEPIVKENVAVRRIVEYLDQGQFERAMQSEVNLLLTAI